MNRSGALLFDSEGHLLPPEKTSIKVLETLTKDRAPSPSRRSPSRYDKQSTGNNFVQEVKQKTLDNDIRIRRITNPTALKVDRAVAAEEHRNSTNKLPKNDEHIVNNHSANTSGTSSKASGLSKSKGKLKMESEDALVLELMEKPVIDWGSKDVGVWLDYIGMSKFKERFLSHNVSGKTLLDLRYETLEELNLAESEDREQFLAEVYHLQQEFGHIDDEEQEADKEIEETLRDASPLANNNKQAVLFFENEAISLTPTDSFASSRTGSDIAPSPPPERTEKEAQKNKEKKDMSKSKNRFEPPITGTTITSNQTSPSKTKYKKELSKQASKKSKPKGKRISRLFNSIHGSHKDPSLLHTAPPIYKNAFHNLMNTGPQGVIKIWTEMFLTDMQYVSLLVKHENTAFEVIKMVLEKSNAQEDPECYRICEINEKKKEYVLERNECPLQRERQWSDPDNCRFELRWRNERLIEWRNATGSVTEDLSKERVAKESTPQENHVEVPNEKLSSPPSSVSTPSDAYSTESPGSNDINAVMETEFAYIVEVDSGRERSSGKTNTKHSPETPEKTGVLPNTLQGQNELNLNTDEPDSIQDAPKRLTSSCPDLSKNDLHEGDPEYGNLLISKNINFLNVEMSDLTAIDHSSSTSSADVSTTAGEFEYSQQLRKSSKRLSERLRLRGKPKIEGESVEIGVDAENQGASRDTIDGKKGESINGASVVMPKDPQVEQNLSEDVLRALEESEQKESRDKSVMVNGFGNEPVSKESGHEELVSTVVFSPDVHQVLENVKELQNDNFLLAEENRELKKKCRTFEGKSGLKERELEEMEVEKNELANQVQDMVAELHSLRAANTELRTEVDEANAKLSDVDGWVTRDVFEDIRGQLSVSLEEVESKENEVEEILRKCKTLEVENMKMKELQVEVERLNERIKEGSKVNEGLKKDMKEQQKKIVKLELETQKLENSLQDKESEKKAADGNLQLVEAEMERLKKIHADEKKDLQKRISDREYEILIMKEEKKELCVKMKSFENNVETLREEMKKKDAENEAAIAEMEAQSAIKDESLSQTFSNLEQLVNERDERIKQLKKQIELSGLPQSELQAKEHEYEQNKVYLKHLIALVKEKDPSILDVLNKTLSSRDSEDWC